MAASEHLRPAKARLCVYGAVYRRPAVHRLDHRPRRPPAGPPKRTRASYTRARGAGVLPIWNCARISAAPCGGKQPSKSCPRRKRTAVPRMERGGRAIFRRIKTKRNPGLFQGQTAHKRVPGVLFLRCGPQPMGRAHKCRRRILCRETGRPCRFARQGLSAFQGCFRITSGGSALPAGRSMP